MVEIDDFIESHCGPIGKRTKVSDLPPGAPVWEYVNHSVAVEEESFMVTLIFRHPGDPNRGRVVPCS